MDRLDLVCVVTLLTIGMSVQIVEEICDGIVYFAYYAHHVMGYMYAR